MAADRFYLPFQQVFDATPTVRSSAKLYFYAAGTSTPLATYSDKDLSSANTNPVVLNALGEPDVAIFLQNLAYKVVLTDSNDVTIWTADNYYGPNYSTVAQVQTVLGSPNGQLAGTAGSAGVPASVAWDATNDILYVCTQTGSVSTAVWTAINAASAANIVTPPQGRLTLTSATPVISSEVTAATTVYYTPYVGNLVPIYNGASFTPTIFSELQLALVSSHAASTIYDVFAFNNSGVVTLVTGPAWATSTAGAGDRGTGAGTTQLSRVNGYLTNAVSMTGRNGATTYTIGANLATYLGSIFIDGSAGQTSCHLTWGQSRKWGLSNAFNRVPIKLIGGDSTASWTYATATARPSNNNSANKVTVLSGLAEEIVDASLLQLVESDTTGAAVLGIGWNSTTTASGTVGESFQLTTSGFVSVRAEYMALPFIGIANVQALENSFLGTTTGYKGGQAFMNLAARWRG